MVRENNENMMLPDEIIMNKIYLIRDNKVMLDRDLAKLYGVETKVLKQQVKRNIDRFPNDFMFELTRELEVPNCDLKLGRYSLSANGIYRTRCRQCFQVF